MSKLICLLHFIELQLEEKERNFITNSKIKLISNFTGFYSSLDMWNRVKREFWQFLTMMFSLSV